MPGNSIPQPAPEHNPNSAGGKVIPFPTDPRVRAELLHRARMRRISRALAEVDGIDRGFRMALDIVYRLPLNASRADILRALNQQAPWEQRQRQRWGGVA